jgi:hypothetical protein
VLLFNMLAEPVVCSAVVLFKFACLIRHYGNITEKLSVSHGYFNETTWNVGMNYEFSLWGGGGGLILKKHSK